MLDCTLDTFTAVVEGYKARLLAQEILLIQGGFFAGYYSRAKKPKPLKSIINKLIQKASRGGKLTAPAPDVAKFEELEKLFLKKGSELKRG